MGAPAQTAESAIGKCIEQHIISPHVIVTHGLRWAFFEPHQRNSTDELTAKLSTRAGMGPVMARDIAHISTQLGQALSQR